MAIDRCFWRSPSFAHLTWTLNKLLPQVRHPPLGALGLMMGKVRGSDATSPLCIPAVSLLL